jgi:hypothetical protein
LRGELNEVKDTSREGSVDASLRTADDEVAARETWLDAVDDHDI